MALNPKIKVGIAAAIMILAWIFYIVANAVPSWSTLSSTQSSSYSYNYGLWKTCTTLLSVTQCTEWDCSGTSSTSSTSTSSSTSNTCSKITAAKAFVTLACLFSVFSAICLLVTLALSDRIKSMVLLAGKVLAFICLIFGIIGVALGISALTTFDLGTTTGISLSWGAGSIIGIIAIITNLVGGVVAALIKSE